jgi:hypothetical protein
VPSAGETVCRKALDAPERRDHSLLNTVHLAVMESRCDQLNWDHSAPACDERDTFLSGIGQALGRYSLRPAWWPQRWRSYDDLFGRWSLASPSRRSSTRPQRGPAGCRRADTRTVARDHEGAAHQHLGVGPCAGRTLRGRAQLQRPKCGGYRTARSRVRVVVRKPGQQRGRAGCFRGSPRGP